MNASPRTYTTTDAAAELGVPRTVIAMWKYDGKVMPVGYVKSRGPDAPLYDLEELRPLAEQWLATRPAKA